MVYQKTITLDYSTLPEQTRYRFAEIEMSYALNTLQALFKHQHNTFQLAQRTIFELAIPKERQYKEIEDRFMAMMTSHYFKNPIKEEVIDYLRFKNVSYRDIMKITNSGPNTVSARRFEAFPNHYPLFHMWDAATLSKWDDVKGYLNIFAEKLIHIK
jgi:hypothetical protein